MEQNKKKLMNFLKCKICNSPFVCNIENGKDSCWCFDYPNIIRIESDKCICKECLEKKINTEKE